MQQSQSQIETTFDPKKLCSLINPSQISCFKDKKTNQLYSILADIQDSSINEIQMEEANQSTMLKSRFHISKHRQFKRIKDEAYAISGISLRENSKSEDFNKNRTYSIIKTKKHRKKTINASEFQKIYDQNQKTKQIVYQYDLKNTLKLKTMPLQNQPKQIQQTLKSSRNDQHSFVSTIQNNCGLLSKYAKLYCQKMKKYQFTQLKKNLKVNQTKNQSCNAFNCLDSFANKQGYQQIDLGCFWQKLQVISKPIKHRK